MATILALFSSLLWGSADFLGGKLTKRYPALAVTALSQSFGLVTGILIVVISSSWLSPSLSWSNYLLPGVFAGLLGFIGLIAFYTGLATGQMGVVAPISALSVLIPLTIAFINGEKPNSMQLSGMSIALIGAVFASGPEIKSGMTIRPLVYAVIAAFGFGGAVAFIAQGSSSSAIMTMTTMRLTTFIVSLFLLAKYRTLGGLSKKNIPILIVIGAADFIANLFLGVATTKGLVSLAVVLGSLYPIVTALLAFKLLQERLQKVQYVGIVFAITGVAFIAAG
ncbi:MAG: DMT family transporter [Actinomycetota bacterium]|nr:DMT family transporter [Actinomycetota bacterium]